MFGEKGPKFGNVWHGFGKACRGRGPAKGRRFSSSPFPLHRPVDSESCSNGNRIARRAKRSWCPWPGCEIQVVSMVWMFHEPSNALLKSKGYFEKFHDENIAQ